MRAALIVRKIAGAGKLHGRCRVSYACGVIYDKKDRDARASSCNVRSSAGMAVSSSGVCACPPRRCCEGRGELHTASHGRPAAH